MARSEKRSLKMPWESRNPLNLIYQLIQSSVDNHNGGVPFLFKIARIVLNHVNNYYFRDPGDLPIAMRRRYFAILFSQKDGFWLAHKLSCKHDSTALNGFSAHRSKFYFCE